MLVAQNGKDFENLNSEDGKNSLDIQSEVTNLCHQIRLEGIASELLIKASKSGALLRLASSVLMRTLKRLGRDLGENPTLSIFLNLHQERKYMHKSKFLAPVMRASALPPVSSDVGMNGFPDSTS